jgi:hypothetical protein
MICLIALDSSGQISHVMSFKPDTLSLYSVEFVDTNYDEQARKGILHINLRYADFTTEPSGVKIVSATDLAFENWQKTSPTSFSVEFTIPTYPDNKELEKVNLVVRLEGVSVCDRLYSFSRKHSNNVSVKEISMDEDVVLYPNPSSNIFTLTDALLYKDCSYIIIEPNGRAKEIKGVTVGDDLRFDLYNYPSGNYTLQTVSGGNIVRTLKIIKY